MDYVYLLADYGERHEDCIPLGAYTDLEKLIHGVLKDVAPEIKPLPHKGKKLTINKILDNTRSYKVILLSLDNKIDNPNTVKDFEFELLVNCFSGKIHIGKYPRRMNSHGKKFYKCLKKIKFI